MPPLYHYCEWLSIGELGWCCVPASALRPELGEGAVVRLVKAHQPQESLPVFARIEGFPGGGDQLVSSAGNWSGWAFLPA